MARKYRLYTQEFKLEAIRLMGEANKPVAQIARELGIRVNQLYKWRAQVDKKSTIAFSRTPKESGVDRRLVSNEESEIKALKLRIERLEAEKDILKKAVTYFAKELN